MYPEHNALAVARRAASSTVTEHWRGAASRELMMRRYLGERERAEHERSGRARRRGWLLGRIAIKDAVRLHALAARRRRRSSRSRSRSRNEASGRPIVARPSLRVSVVAQGRHRGRDRRRATRDVGIDIERIEPRTDDVRDGRVHRRASSRSAPAGRRDEWIARLWAAKEAVGKARGTGVTDPKQLEVRAATAIALDDRRHRRSTRGATATHVIAWTRAEDAGMIGERDEILRDRREADRRDRRRRAAARRPDHDGDVVQRAISSSRASSSSRSPRSCSSTTARASTSSAGSRRRSSTRSSRSRSASSWSSSRHAARSRERPRVPRPGARRRAAGRDGARPADRQPRVLVLHRRAGARARAIACASTTCAATAAASARATGYDVRDDGRRSRRADRGPAGAVRPRRPQLGRRSSRCGSRSITPSACAGSRSSRRRCRRRARSRWPTFARRRATRAEPAARRAARAAARGGRRRPAPGAAPARVARVPARETLAARRPARRAATSPTPSSRGCACPTLLRVRRSLARACRPASGSRASMPGAQLVVLPGGHYLHLDARAALAARARGAPRWLTSSRTACASTCSGSARGAAHASCSSTAS